MEGTLNRIQIGDFVGGRYAVTRVVGKRGILLRCEGLSDLGVAVVITLWEPTSARSAGTESDQLKREASGWAMVEHANLATVIDYGFEDGRLFVVHALHLGDQLIELSLPSLSPDRAASWLLGLAAATAELHAQGRVHGDICEENIRIKAGGDQAMLELPGLAILVERTGRNAGRSVLSAHIAPEAKAETFLEPTADVYALGVLAFKLLAGHFRREDGMPSYVPEDLQMLVMESLQEDAAKRPRSAEQFLERLQHHIEAVASAMLPPMLISDSETDMEGPSAVWKPIPTAPGPSLAIVPQPMQEIPVPEPPESVGIATLTAGFMVGVGLVGLAFLAGLVVALL